MPCCIFLRIITVVQIGASSLKKIDPTKFHVYMAALINILMYAVKIEHFPGPKGMDLSANIAVM